LVRLQEPPASAKKAPCRIVLFRSWTIGNLYSALKTPITRP